MAKRSKGYTFKNEPYLCSIEEIDRYALGIYNEEIPVCIEIKQAIDRHFYDLSRIDSEDFPFFFYPKAASLIFKYFSQLKHWKGELAGQNIKLEDWQKFAFGSIFGWVEKETGLRRFNEAYNELPRKNGKTTAAAGVGLFGMDRDGEPGAEVYSVATSKEQASIVFEDAVKMVEHNPKLRNRLTTTRNAIALTVPPYGFFKPQSKEHKRKDGFSTHIAIMDEFHAWEKRELYDVFDTSLGSRLQALLFEITTAGDNRSGICYEIRKYAKKILSRIIEDERFFALIYTIDPEDLKKWDDPEVWRKANPNLGVSKYIKDMKRIATKAAESEAKKNDFVTKHLNIWISSFSSWMDLNKWEKTVNPDLKLEDFDGEECFIACDLASKLDLASLYMLFKRDDKYYIFGRNYLPEETVDKNLIGSRSVYKAWSQKKLVTITPGVRTDYDFIQSDIEDLCKRFKVKKIGFDPFQAEHLVQKLSAQKLPVVEIRHTVTHLSEPMKMLEARVFAQEVESNDPVLTWSISNVIAKYDAKDNIYPRKENNDEKIDPAVAVIMCFALELKYPLDKIKKKKRKPRTWKA